MAVNRFRSILPSAEMMAFNQPRGGLFGMLNPREHPFSALDPFSAFTLSPQLTSEHFHHRPSPHFSVHEDEKSVIIEAATPGFKKENLSVAIENNVLTVKGKISTSTKSERPAVEPSTDTTSIEGTAAPEADLSVSQTTSSVDTKSGPSTSIVDAKQPDTAVTSYSSTSYASFQRSFQLPDYLNGAAANASYEDGLLKVKLIRPDVMPAQKMEIAIE